MAADQELSTAESVYWKRLDSTTWGVLRGINRQTTGGGNHHIAMSARLPLERVFGDFDPPSSPDARVPGTIVGAVTLPDGSSREIEISMDIRGGDRTEVLLRRQFGAGQALPLWYEAAAASSDLLR